MKKAIQDLYADDFAVCYGCGKNNSAGYQLKTYLDGDETVSRFMPEEHHIAMEGVVYGGLCASILDCHGTGSAAIYICRDQGISMEGGTVPVRCVTASLKVDFKAPTPTGVELEVRGRLKKLEGRKVWVDMELITDGKVTVTGEILAIRLKEENR